MTVDISQHEKTSGKRKNIWRKVSTEEKKIDGVKTFKEREKSFSKKYSLYKVRVVSQVKKSGELRKKNFLPDKTTTSPC